MQGVSPLILFVCLPAVSRILQRNPHQLVICIDRLVSQLHQKVVKLGGHYTVNLFEAEKVNGHCPSVDVLFRSVANTVKGDAVGIILTGMGQDGAYGLLEMRKAGAYTIGQNKESCVVYGMPMVAQNIGAVAIQAACESIPNVLVNFLNKL